MRHEETVIPADGPGHDRLPWPPAAAPETPTTTETGAGAETQEPAGSESVVPPVEDPTDVDTSTIPGLEDGVLTVGMECAYAPYNWTQMDDSNGAVPISNVPGAYANGYDVMIAKRICERLRLGAGDRLQRLGLPDSRRPVRHHGRRHRRPVHDRRPDGRRWTWRAPTTTPPSSASPPRTARMPTPPPSADLAGGTCTAQSGTIWYDSCLPQIEDANGLARRRDRARHDHGRCRPAPWTSSAPICPPPWAPWPRTTTW